MNKKGFTLIELMAVIIVLILIFLISVPVVSNITSSSKKNAAKTNTLNYIDALETDNLDLESGIYEVSEIEVEVKGKRPSSGTITIDKGNVEEATLCMNGYKVNYNGKEATIGDKCSNEEMKPKYKESLLNGTDPVLKDDMIAVTIGNDGTVKKANTKSEWYNYEDKKWANAVVLVDDTNYNVGDTIPEEKIKAYYVWIPRYKYKLFSNTTESSIEIVFENKNTEKSEGTQVGEYRSHPAFTYGNKELNGFWVGKFEPSVETSDACYTSVYPTNCNKELKDIRIKPNVSSLRCQQVLNQYLTAMNVSDYSKMMKNDEWGAVAYLSHSIYGLNGKVRINNSNKYITGCGADTDGKASAASCDIAYGNSTNYPQSTTGNISGIFDMSGGAWEYMMSVLSDKNGKAFSGRHNLYNSGFNGKFGCPTCDSQTITELTSGTNFPNSNDYNLYYNSKDITDNRTNTNVSNACNGSICYGHALNEMLKNESGGTRQWHGEFHRFVSNDIPWILRSGGCGDGTLAGIFGFSSDYGQFQFDHSFRVVVR